MLPGIIEALVFRGVIETMLLVQARVKEAHQQWMRQRTTSFLSFGFAVSWSEFVGKTRSKRELSADRREIGATTA